MNIAKVMARAYQAAAKSPDPSTQNGSAMFSVQGGQLLVGWNHPPRGVRFDSERVQRPAKYNFVEHAERHVIFEAARIGVCTTNMVMVCPWAACAPCARAIAMSGVRKLITHKPRMDINHEHWNEEIRLAHKILAESGVDVRTYEGPILNSGIIRVDGRPWSPEHCDFLPERKTW